MLPNAKQNGYGGNQLSRIDLSRKVLHRWLPGGYENGSKARPM